jgi:23S rRNA pseudouridine955/2504/2580 synthase
MAGNETLTVEGDEAGMRLDRWFKAHYPEVSFGHLQKLLRSGQVRVDGGRVKSGTRLEPGQAVRVPPLAPAGASGAAGAERPHAAGRSGKGEGAGAAAAPRESRPVRREAPMPTSCAR